ncbi:hypothetical protein [Streptomyces sp. NPDC048277]
MAALSGSAAGAFSWIRTPVRAEASARHGRRYGTSLSGGSRQVA